MNDECRVKIVVVWECPTCGNQTVTLEGEQDGYQGRPYICDGLNQPHPTVEREQKMPEAFEAWRQGIGVDARSSHDAPG